MPSLEPYENESLLIDDLKMQLHNVGKAKGILHVLLFFNFF